MLTSACRLSIQARHPVGRAAPQRRQATLSGARWDFVEEAGYRSQPSILDHCEVRSLDHVRFTRGPEGPGEPQPVGEAVGAAGEPEQKAGETLLDGADER